ncbi:MAG: MerR family transcriptional regulator [Anaerolineae bacterium]
MSCAAIDRRYYSLHPTGRETCLNCPLPACVHEGRARLFGLEESDCPVQPRPRNAPNPDLERVAELTTDNPMTVAEIAADTGISRASIQYWVRKKLLRAQRRGRGRGRFIVRGWGAAR